MTENKDVFTKFTMDDVNSAHALKPYLSKRYFLKKFAYLNRQINKGWDLEKIVKLISLMKKMEDDRCLN